MTAQSFIINKKWDEFLSDEIHSEYFTKLMSDLDDEYLCTKVFPPRDLVFEAFRLCAPDRVKVVIIGQDPYHEIGQACGLAFSVPSGVKMPPSLLNIIKEVKDETGRSEASFSIETSHRTSSPRSVLEPWALQGVLLLNSILTVRESNPLSHQALGWQKFTDAVITRLSQLEAPIVFILFGNFAKSKERIIRSHCLFSGSKLILTGAHPSPLSARRGFFGGNYFTLANDFLTKHKTSNIDWTLDYF